MPKNSFMNERKIKGGKAFEREREVHEVIGPSRCGLPVQMQ